MSKPQHSSALINNVPVTANAEIVREPGGRRVRGQFLVAARDAEDLRIASLRSGGAFYEGPVFEGAREYRMRCRIRLGEVQEDAYEPVHRGDFTNAEIPELVKVGRSS